MKRILPILLVLFGVLSCETKPENLDAETTAAIVPVAKADATKAASSDAGAPQADAAKKTKKD